MIRFFDFLTQSNLFISICSLALYLFYSLKGDANFSISTPFLIVGGTYIGYHLIRYIPLKRGYFIESELKSYYEKYKKFTLVSIIIAALFSLYGISGLTLTNYISLTIALIFLIFYEKIFSNNFEFRKLPYTKPFIISLVWTIVCTCLNESIDIYETLECFIFILLLSIPFDIKDINSDIKQQLLTLPMLLKKSIYPILATAYFLYGTIYYYLTGEVFLLTSIVIYISLLKLSIKYKRLYYLGFDGLIALRFVFYLYQN